MSHPVDKKIDALLWCPLTHVIVEREYDSRTAVHSPEEHPDPVFRSAREVKIPQNELLVQRPTLCPEWCVEIPVSLVPVVHKALHVMTGNQLVMDCRS